MPTGLEKHLYFICEGSVRETFGDEGGITRIAEEEIISELVAEGATVNFHFKGSNPLCEACRRGKLDIAQALIRHGADVNIADKYLCSPLYLAASHGHFRLCKLLLQAGADINQENKFRYTPLFSAIENAHFKLSVFLIKEGAGVNLRAPVSSRMRAAETLFDYVAFQTNADNEMKPLAVLLLQAGVKVKRFSKKSSFWILNMSQISWELLMQMLKVGFSFDFQEITEYIEKMKEDDNDDDDDDDYEDDDDDQNKKEFLENLRDFTHNPHSLQNIARMKIRELLVQSQGQGHIFRKIDCLPIPNCLKHYLKLKDIF